MIDIEEDIALKAINTIRGLSIDAVQKANSGHPGMPMGTAPIAYMLWKKFMNFNPGNPDWWNRDRFILSAGHGSMLLYSMLHLTGYDMTMDDLMNFRQWESKTPGHPEYKAASGIESTTGPLGQGFATGIGLAIGQKYLAARYNKDKFPLFDYKIYAIVSDGDLMEGISHEAASYAGHLKLGNIIYIYDNNHITIEGKTDLTYSDDVLKRFESYNWHVQNVDDGNDLDSISAVIQNAINETGKPSLIQVRTHIAYGSPNKQDTAEAHGSPLGEDEVKLTKIKLNLDPDADFNVPETVYKHFKESSDKGAKKESEWKELLLKYKSEFNQLAIELDFLKNKKLPVGWDRELISFSAEKDKAIATRTASGKFLNSVASLIPNLIGGSADLAPSTDTLLKDFKSFQHNSYEGRNFHFGVREHAMGAIVNGLALTGGLIPYGSTFLIFSDYMKPAIRIAALSEIQSIFVFTHDSIGLGEDGPTHQPVEQLAGLRAMPNLTVIRPAPNETPFAWKAAIENKKGPTAIILSRQKIPIIDNTKFRFLGHVENGAYIIIDSKQNDPELILIGSGSELNLVFKAGEKLIEEGYNIRVVSMPSWELFEKQNDEYKELIFPKNIVYRLAVEASSPFGWERYTGDKGKIIGVNRFGASAPGEIVLENFGFTIDNIVKEAKLMLGK